MPSNQPSSAPIDDAPKPTDDLTAAAVLRDDALDRPAGGGGLGTPIARDASGAASPNSPVDAPVPHEGGDALAGAEARRLSTSSAPAEPGHGSQ